MYERNNNVYRRTIILFLIVLIITIILGVLITLAITKNIASPLKIACGDLNQMTTGDFSGDIPEIFTSRKDEIGQIARAVNTMKNSIGQFVSTVKEYANNLLEFVSTDVSEDYKMFLNVADKYSDDSSYVDHLVTDFSATTQQLLASIDGILKTIDGVAQAANEGAEGTTDIANRISGVTSHSDSVLNLIYKAKESSDGLIAYHTI